MSIDFVGLCIVALAGIAGCIASTTLNFATTGEQRPSFAAMLPCLFAAMIISLPLLLLRNHDQMDIVRLVGVLVWLTVSSALVLRFLFGQRSQPFWIQLIIQSSFGFTSLALALIGFSLIG
jgi:hypothetical protein